MKHIHTDRDRHGNERVYYQKGRGAPKIRLRHPKGSPEFMEEYRAAANLPAKLKAPKFEAGTFGALIDAYYDSPEFRVSLKASTQQVRKRILDKLKAKHGHKLVMDMERRHVLDLRNEAGLAPHAANNRLKVLKALFRWAVDAGRAPTNPTREVSKIKVRSDGHEPWSMDEIARFLETHPPGSKARLAFMLLLCTGARKSDVVTFGRHIVEAGALKYRVNKTGRWIITPLAKQLSEEIGHLPKDQVMFLLTEYGKPFTVNGFGNWFRDRCDEAGVSKSAHGLRKAGAAIIAERGATENEIMAFGGWASPSEAAHYTRSANQGRLAASAVRKLERKRDK
ncbi:MAG TPA: tyrosine-type recombinase/integrase [Prosthecobacter sp.]|nr:tyrosine-type recombinase/integrase [Prosthecobacter sp.]